MNYRFRTSRVWLLTIGFLLGMAATDMVQAVGLGNIKVFSYLNENLDAEIQLLSEHQDIDSILVSVASQEEFEHAGIARTALLDKLTFQIVRDEDEVYIHATSADFITEPYLDLLLDLSWGSGRLIRRYTILLDPIPLEGKPAHARRRQLPNFEQKPTHVSKAEPKQYTGATKLPDIVEDLRIPTAPLVLAHPDNEPGIPLKKGQAAIVSAAPATPAKVSVAPPAAGGQEMASLFEQDTHQGELATVVEDVRQLIVGPETSQAEQTWFGNGAAIVDRGKAEAHQAAKAALPSEHASGYPTGPATVPTLPEHATGHAATTAKHPADDLRSQLKPKKVPEAGMLEPVMAPVKAKHTWKDFSSLIGTALLSLVLGIVLFIHKRRQRAAAVAQQGPHFSEEESPDLTTEVIDEMRADNIDESLAIDLATDPEMSRSALDEGFGEKTQVVPPPPISSPPKPSRVVIQPTLDYAQLDAVLGEETPEQPPLPFTLEDPVPTPIETLPEITIDMEEPLPEPEEMIISEVPAPSFLPEDMVEEIDIMATDVVSSSEEEAALKLQLAQQYVDMGDFSGAKGLLEYVLASGSEVDKHQAEILLEKIGDVAI